MKTLFALSAALLMAICHALESAKSATDLGAMPNSCRAGLASGASFGTIVDNEGAGHVLGDVEDSIYPYCFPCYFGTRERLGQTGKMYIKENRQDCMLVEPGDVFLCKLRLELPLDLQDGVEFLYSQGENRFFFRNASGAFLESENLTKAAFGRDHSPEGGLALGRGMTTSEMYSYLNSSPLVITGYESQKMIRNYKWIRQFDTSFYIAESKRDSDGVVIGTAGEPNCVLNSTFSVLYNLPRVYSPSGICWHYDSTLLGASILTSIDLTSPMDPLYSSLGVGRIKETGTSQDGYAYTTRYVSNHFSSASFPTESVLSRMPAGYPVLRQTAIDLGYSGEGDFAYWNFPNLFESLNSTYSVNIDGLRWQSQDTVASNIDYGIPSVIGVMGSPNFGNHAMAVYGYLKYYERVYTSQGAYNTISKYFWAVDSGHYADTDPKSIFLDSDGKYRCWYTPDGYYETFATVKRSSLTWPSC
ncbi:MAG: hypothetical protein J6A47_03255 [Bacilli bacterium]|nr:hypothetical protein [Bacilli bacterium]